MEFKGSFKVDFKEAREKAGLTINVVENAINSLPGYSLNIAAIENNSTKITQEQVNTLMGVYNVPVEHQKGYYEKYSNM